MVDKEKEVRTITFLKVIKREPRVFFLHRAKRYIKTVLKDLKTDSNDQKKTLTFLEMKDGMSFKQKEA